LSLEPSNYGKEAVQMHDIYPHWFESFAGSYPWIVPLIAIVSLWLARASNDSYFRRIAEPAFFGALLIVSWGTLRTIIANEGCWIVHTSSMAVMVVGAIFPSHETHGSDAMTESSGME
jgi:hypothetical protein